PPVVLINTDEEVGSRESTRHIRRLARIADRCLVLEPSLGPEGRLKTARKGVGRFTITIRGRAAHAGLNPEEGASAILELSHVIQKLFALNDPERGVTVNVGMIDGGLRANVIAPTSEATVDVRVLQREDGERIERIIHGLRPETEGVTIEVRGGIGRPPMEPTEGNRRLWRLAREAGEVLGLELEEGIAGGGSDGNTTSLYAPTLDGLGPVGDGAHARHEHVRLEHLAERTALLAALLLAPPLMHREVACA
ncbi:MAG: M20 family peptidase, partial [Gammaproteobacteria bacterium]